MARKIVKKIPAGKHEVRIYRDSEWDEYVVRVFTDGKPEQGDGYFSTEKQDAIDTANHIAKQISNGDYTLST